MATGTEIFSLSDMKKSAIDVITKTKNKAKEVENQLYSRRDGNSVMQIIVYLLCCLLWAGGSIFVVVYYWHGITALTGNSWLQFAAIASGTLLAALIASKEIASVKYYSSIFRYHSEIRDIHQQLESNLKSIDALDQEFSSSKGWDYSIPILPDVENRIDSIVQSISSLEALSTRTLNACSKIAYYIATGIWTFFLSSVTYNTMLDIVNSTFENTLDYSYNETSSGFVIFFMILACGVQYWPAVKFLAWKSGKVVLGAPIMLLTGIIAFWTVGSISVGIGYVIWAICMAVYWIFWALKWALVAAFVIGLLWLIGAIFSSGS